MWKEEARWGEQEGRVRLFFFSSAVVIFELFKVDHRVRSQAISMQAHQQEYHAFHYSFEFSSTQSGVEKNPSDAYKIQFKVSPILKRGSGMLALNC